MKRPSIPAPARSTLAPDAASGPLARRSVVAVLLQALVAGCARPVEDDIRIEMKIEPKPPAAGIAHVEVRIRDAQGRLLEARSVALEGNMSHPGMKPTFATAKRVGEGRWLADLELTMGGDWVVLVEALLDDGREVRRTIELPGVDSR